MKTSTTDNFFAEQKEKSKVKTYIVSEFFKAYYSILYNANLTKDGITYIDLFSGPGIYDDGTKSTPAILLDIINNSEMDMAKKILMIFNDENTIYYNSLKSYIENHAVYNKMARKPIIYNKSANEVNIKSYLSKPIFSFVDPWGYKDVSAEQIKDLVESIGSDCILFFNVNRILQDLPKPTSCAHMQKIFGIEYSNACILAEDKQISQHEKGKKFVELFSKNLYNQEFAALKSNGYRLFVLPFAFKQDEMDKTSHYILFISKNHKAILEMKNIMVKKSNSNTSELSYDDKNALNFSFFSRDDNIKQDIENTVIKMLLNNQTLVGKEASLSKWFEYVDRYNMKTQYIVTPYTFKEFQETISLMDENNLINVVSEVKRKRITQKAVISFNSNVLEKK